MFYHCDITPGPVRALVALTPAEGKRLIAKGVAALPEVKQALQEGTVIVSRGTTNAYVVEELIGGKVDPKWGYAAGMLAEGELTVLPTPLRRKATVLRQGRETDLDASKALLELTPRDIFIKGANAIDPAGNAGVLVANNRGGTIGEGLAIFQARGIRLLAPVGLEKLIPDVGRAAWWCGIDRFKYSTGVPVGMIVMTNAVVLTEVQALGVLFGVEAVPVAGGGIGGSEGCALLSVAGSEPAVEGVVKLVKSIKGEAGIPCPAARTNPPAVQFEYDAAAQWQSLSRRPG